MEKVTQARGARKVDPPILTEHDGKLVVDGVLIPVLPFAQSVKLFRKLWSIRDQIIFHDDWSWDANWTVTP